MANISDVTYEIEIFWKLNQHWLSKIIRRILRYVVANIRCKVWNGDILEIEPTFSPTSHGEGRGSNFQFSSIEIDWLGNFYGLVKLTSAQNHLYLPNQCFKKLLQIWMLLQNCLWSKIPSKIALNLILTF